ncbi:hypothetical protein AVEN_189871-1 [Araneus ventricosus]|uniref:Reverse transcriptase Ty1/copia-type domain-containing protein n=1 Tax=Araneus ventricosus TaxID=182803 RepID=A0A4Y2EE97_ARAVE|nr:hypothetical protein AVEN_189871-1 [Araneus ventricosus]
MITRKVWELVDPPANKTIIGSKWVYNIKHDEKIKPKKYKAGLVALGIKQKAGIDYGEAFSPVVNFSVVKLMFIVLISLLGLGIAIRHQFRSGRIGHIKTILPFHSKINCIKDDQVSVLQSL